MKKTNCYLPTATVQKWLCNRPLQVSATAESQMPGDDPSMSDAVEACGEAEEVSTVDDARSSTCTVDDADDRASLREDAVIELWLTKWWERACETYPGTTFALSQEQYAGIVRRLYKCSTEAQTQEKLSCC